MEFCNGGDLEKYLEKKKSLSEDEATMFLKQILNGFKVFFNYNVGTPWSRCHASWFQSCQCSLAQSSMQNSRSWFRKTDGKKSTNQDYPWNKLNNGPLTSWRKAIWILSRYLVNWCCLLSITLWKIPLYGNEWLRYS